ncbi:hypothetical protein AAG614_15605, partial [Citromicrobium bathyomarinum]
LALKSLSNFASLLTAGLFASGLAGKEQADFRRAEVSRALVGAGHRDVRFNQMARNAICVFAQGVPHFYRAAQVPSMMGECNWQGVLFQASVPCFRIEGCASVPPSSSFALTRANT